MRKGLAMIMIVSLFHVFFSGTAFGADIKVVINGQEKSFSPAPVIKNGSALVPMRAFFEALGCKVDWDNPTRTAIGKRDNQEVRLTIGSKEAFVDGQKKELSVEAQLINDSTFLCCNISKRDSSGIGSNTAQGGSTGISSRNDIIWGNTEPEGAGPQVNLANVGGEANSIIFRASYSNIPSVNAFKGASINMENVLDKNPLFIDTASGNFLLQDGSPCIDMGDAGADYCDGSRPPARGTERNDMGAYGGPQNNKWLKLSWLGE